MLIETSTLVSKASLRLRFNSDDFGQVGFLNKPADDNAWIVTSRGIALKLAGKAKITQMRSNEFGNWYNFKADTLGGWANIVEPDNDLICRIASQNPHMVLNSWDDLEQDYAHRHDFKRHKRPFARFSWVDDPVVGILYEYYPAPLSRVGFFIGRDEFGHGGHVVFMDKAEFKFL